MTTDTHTFAGTTTYDGTADGEIDSKSADTGTLWYLDEYYSDGPNVTSGPNDYYTLDLELVDPNGNVRESVILFRDDLDYNGGGSQGSGSVGAYVYPGESVRIRETSDAMNDTSQTVYYFAAMRRVL